MMLTYRLDQRQGRPKYEYLYQLLKEDILAGKLPPGSRLPSKRAFAEHLGVSVVTVDTAYAQLIEEGYAFSRERSGCYVQKLEAPGIRPDHAPKLVPVEDPPPKPQGNLGFRYSALTRIMREVITEYGARLLEKPPPFGCAELRNAIAEYLLRYRGMAAQPDRILIGSGSEYFYGIIVQLLGRDKVYGLEDPSYEKIRLVYEAQGARCEMLELDEDGISTRALAASQADVLHVTPYHSFPSGVSAPASKRYEYLSWALQRRGWVVEDDFKSEFSRNKKPLETMYSMDRRGCVIYMNTFSHSLAPSMRVGYMILPDSLMEEYEKRLGFYTCSVPLFDQYVLAKYISRGYFERYLNRVRRQMKTESQG